MLVFKHYSDDSHGWIAVKKKLIDDLNLSKKITVFSFQKGKTVYLEEDCDASVFLDELKKRDMNCQIISIHHKNKSPIRGYERYASQ